MIDHLSELYDRADDAIKWFRENGDSKFIDQVIFDMRSEIEYIKGLQKEVIKNVKSKAKFEEVAVEKDKLFSYQTFVKDLENQINKLKKVLDNPF